MDGPTDRRTDRPSYGDAWTNLKMSEEQMSFVNVSKVLSTGDVVPVMLFPKKYRSESKGELHVYHRNIK